MSRINSVSPSFGVNKMNIPKDRLLNLKNHQLKDVMSQIESKNPDNITFLINLPKIGFEFDVPYSQLNKKEQKKNLRTL